MAWTPINTSIGRGSLVQQSNIGVWLSTVSSQADNITASHCSAYKGAVNTSHNSGYDSVCSYGTGDGNKSNTSNRSVKYSGFNKCGGEIIINLKYI